MMQMVHELLHGVNKSHRISEGIYGLVNQDEHTIVEAVRKGFRYDMCKPLRNTLNISVEHFSRVLGISTRTLAQRKKRGVFKSQESDRLFRIARLITLAGSVFEDIEDGVEWLKTPNKAFYGETPLQYASTEAGARRVEEILYAIEFSMVA